MLSPDKFITGALKWSGDLPPKETNLIRNDVKYAMCSWSEEDWKQSSGGQRMVSNSSQHCHVNGSSFFLTYDSLRKILISNA